MNAAAHRHAQQRTEVPNCSQHSTACFIESACSSTSPSHPHDRQRVQSSFHESCRYTAPSAARHAPTMHSRRPALCTDQAVSQCITPPELAHLLDTFMKPTRPQTKSPAVCSDQAVHQHINETEQAVHQYVTEPEQAPPSPKPLPQPDVPW